MRPLRSRKGQWLLALLLLREGRTVERDWLAGLLWRDSSTAQALYNLRRNLTDLRDALGPEAHRLETPTPRTLRLDLAGADIDVLRFDAAIAAGDLPSLERAVHLYRGPLLMECMEEWITPERTAREQAYLGALETLAGEARARGDREAERRYLRRALAVDPLRENAQQALMEALAAQGDLSAALLVYREYRQLLHRESSTAPSPEITALFQQLRAGARSRERRLSLPSPDSRGAAPEAMAPIVGRHQTGHEKHAHRRLSSRIPHPVSSFVGRDQEVREIAARLATVRLVTLTGSGGVGKTRLAIRVADAVADDYLNGVCFVDLSRLSDPTLVPQAVASVLAVREQPDRSLTETLAEFLRAKQLLLVLDNCEHLLSACAELVEALLSRSPELRVLATSRQLLGLTGEVVWPLSGLSVPPPETAGPPPETLLQFEAVRLFVERAMGTTPSFTLTERSARRVGEICQRLDGIPLAIELAAARLRALSVEEIAARLDDRLRLLTGGSRTAQPRHQTLRATMDWSYELLSPPERLLLQQLSVFAGSFSLQAVESICGDFGFLIFDFGLPARSKASGPDPDGPIQNRKSKIQNEEVLDLLTQLVDQSLVIVERGDERRSVSSPAAETGTRYRLLETVRQYALERLRAEASERGERDEERVRRRHLEFYLRLAEEAAPYLWSQEQAVWLERLEVELDNLRAALDWALEREPEQEVALRLAVALAGFWIQRRYLEEGCQRLAAALERAGPARRSPAGAWALTQLGHLSFLRDDYLAARPFYEEGLVLQREVGDPVGVAFALWGFGHVARRQQEYAEARALHEESLAIRRALGDRYGIAGSLIGLADTLREQGDDPSVWASYSEEALAIGRELDDRPWVADALGQLANVAWRQGDYDQARRYREESLALWRSIGSRLAVIHCLGALGHLARDQREYEDARAFYAESLQLRWELGDLYTLIQALEDFAELAEREGAWARMTRLLGAAEALREGMDRPLGPRERAEYDRYLSGAHEALGDTAVTVEWEAGQAMSLDQAIALALETGALEAGSRAPPLEHHLQSEPHRMSESRWERRRSG